MGNVNSFYLSGEKDLIFRREKDVFISFDPVDLEFIEINLIGAEILYLISQNNDLQTIINYFVNEYGFEEDEIKNDIIEFIKNYRCKKLIENLLEKLHFDCIGD